MFETIAIGNFLIWVVLLIIYLVGNLTYADYYTNIRADVIYTINYIFMIVGLSTFIVFLVECASPPMKVSSPTFMWFLFITCVLYIVSVVYVIHLYFIKLKKYFGIKRGKIQ